MEVDKLLEKRSPSWPVCVGGEQGEGWLAQADSEGQCEDAQD